MRFLFPVKTLNLIPSLNSFFTKYGNFDHINSAGPMKDTVPEDFLVRDLSIDNFSSIVSKSEATNLANSSPSTVATTPCERRVKRTHPVKASSE